MNTHKSCETRKLAIDYYLNNEVSKIFQIGSKIYSETI